MPTQGSVALWRVMNQLREEEGTQMQDLRVMKWSIKFIIVESTFWVSSFRYLWTMSCCFDTLFITFVDDSMICAWEKAHDLWTCETTLQNSKKNPISLKILTISSSSVTGDTTTLSASVSERTYFRIRTQKSESLVEDEYRLNNFIC